MRSAAFLLGFIVCSGMLGVLYSFSASGFFPLASTDFHILDQSRLSLKGTTNVSKFNCDCGQKFRPQIFQAAASANRTAVTFSQTKLSLQTTSLDCGNRMMNRDMYKTLRADEHPNITIELRKAVFPPGITIDDCAEWVELDAETVITIAGQARRVPLKVRARSLAAGRFQFRSAQMLRMTDFGLEPPTAMMGAVKVRDEIEIQFDLFVAVGSKEGTLSQVGNP